jgi:ornithine decarboxylase
VFLVKKQGVYRHYFINNGVYQGFGCRVFDCETIRGQPLLTSKELQSRFKDEHPSFIWGQTCDGVDYLTKDELLPRIEEGEWMIFRNMGAYNESLECAFNGFELPKTFYIQ